MDKVCVFACVIMVVIKPYLSIEVRQDEILPWSAAYEKCGNEGLEYNESILKGLEVLRGKTFWIGKAFYSRTSVWIEILGCFEVKPPTDMTELAQILSVGECQTKCKSIMTKSFSYFGYNEETRVCLCAGNIPSQQIEIQDCENKEFLYAYFFYQEYTGTISAGQGNHCTTLQCSSGENQLKTGNCLNTGVAGRCANEDTTTPQWGSNFIQNLNFCKLKNQLLLAPSSYCKIEIHRNQGILSWTNVFRKVDDSLLTKVEGGNEIPNKCLAGQLMYVDGEWKLKTKRRNCSNGIQFFVCREIFTTSTNMTKSKSTSVWITKIKDTDMNTPTSLLNRTQTDVVRSTLKTGLNKSRKQTKNQNDQREYGSNSKTIGAVIGGLLGACSVIALLAVLIVCKVRSIGLFKQSSKHDKEESSQMQFSKAVCQDNAEKKRTATTSNETYGLASNSTAVYAVVNKIKTQKTSNEIYTDAAYGEYDRLNDIKNRKMCQQENVYHSHRLPRNEEDQTYDSSDFGVGKCNGGQDLYDQSITVVEEEY